MTKHMTLFYGIYETAEESALGGLPEVDHHPDTARVWTLHLGRYAWHPTSLNLIARLVDQGTWGAIGYCGGDSWSEWCEVREGGELVALHIYFTEADDPAAALAKGRRLAGHIGYASEAMAVTTAGDWAEHASEAAVNA